MTAMSLCAALLVLLSLLAFHSACASSVHQPGAPDHADATFHFDPPAVSVDTSGGPCSRGVDLSSFSSVEDMRCFRRLGLSFAVVRLWQADCTVDPTAAATIANAWKAGMREVDLYLYPAYGCALSAAEQMDEALNAINSTEFGRAWLDVEPRGSGWAPDPVANQQFVRLALDTLEQRLGTARVGVYTSFFGWPAVVGAGLSASEGFSRFSLWYADPSADADEPGPDLSRLNGGMGGWPRGAALQQQYSTDVKVCGKVVGLNARSGKRAQCGGSFGSAQPRSFEAHEGADHGLGSDELAAAVAAAAAEQPASPDMPVFDGQDWLEPPSGDAPPLAQPPSAAASHWLTPHYREDDEAITEAVHTPPPANRGAASLAVAPKTPAAAPALAPLPPADSDRKKRGGRKQNRLMQLQAHQ